MAAGSYALAAQSIMHAWDQPAEVLLERGTKADAQLLMPRLGEPIEPVRAQKAEPWWRGVDTSGYQPNRAGAILVSQTLSGPID